MPSRKDLSDWLIHFVHDRNTKNEPPHWDLEDDIPCRYPVAFARDGEPIFTHWPEHDEFYAFPHDADPFTVLMKVLNDGHIRAGWSFRRGKPTIYGPRSAVCFTEMPLYALLAYAKSRSDEQNVNTYGIAIPKAEMYLAGARPVIYGLSGNHKELPGHPSGRWRQPRLLAGSCGIAPHEQYRYVAMNLVDDKRIDWSHEREWRWTKEFTENEDSPGLAIWSEVNYAFSQIILIVQNESEAKRLLDQLKAYHDRPFNHADFEVSRSAVERTKVLALDMIADQFRSDPSTRIEDLPAMSLQKFARPKPSAEMVQSVKLAVAKARAAAQKVDKLSSGGGCFGFAWVVTYEAQSEITQVLVNLKYAHVGDGGKYVVDEVMKDVHSPMIDTVESAADVSAKVLTAELGQKFWRQSALD
jgi:hypothetical protein